MQLAEPSEEYNSGINESVVSKAASMQLPQWSAVLISVQCVNRPSYSC